jgi:hypothetical protein
VSEGFFLLHRGWRDNPIFKGEFSRADAWVWLIENACWKPSRTRIKGSTVELARGEMSFSVRFLADKWGWSKSRVDRFLDDLRSESMIKTRSKIGTDGEQKAGQGQSIITICNYAKYQDVRDDNRDNSGTVTGTTAGQQRDKEEQGNKGTIEEEPIGSSPPEGSTRRKSRSAGTNERSEGLNPRSTGRNPRSNPPAQTPIPDWVPAEQWNAFLEMRREKKKFPSEHAVRLLVGKLEKLRRDGHDPGAVLDQSTVNNWTDVYGIKDQQNGTGYRQQSSHDRRDGLERAIDRRIPGL